MALYEIKYRIALSLVPGIGPIKARGLVRKFGSASNVFRDRSLEKKLMGKTWETLVSFIRSARVMQDAEAELDLVEREGIRILCFDDPAFPKLLGKCNDAPFILYVRGNAGLNPEKCLSVVGTRNASSYGRDMCRKIIGELAAAVPDLVIVSGLAYGIDVMAHRMALECGLPTIAVLGHGLSTLYPARHRETARQICGQGALMTDFVYFTKPERNNFLRRNRIIAGFSPATLVVESALRGGALVTAGQASAYNRDVLAVPGRSSDPVSLGCNRLIRNMQAALTESGADVIHHLNWNDVASGDPEEERILILTDGEKSILQALAFSPGVHPDELLTLTGIPMNRLLSTLLDLELKDWIHMDPGMRYSLNPCYLTLLKDIANR